jgi:hypothetical protein
MDRRDLEPVRGCTKVLNLFQPSLPSANWLSLNFLCRFDGVIPNARVFTGGRRDLLVK